MLSKIRGKSPHSFARLWTLPFKGAEKPLRRCCFGTLPLLAGAASLDTVISFGRDAYQPRGLTPLLDAVARRIHRIDTPAVSGEQQVVVIVTDGYENARADTTLAQILSLAEDRQDRGWEFLHLAADQAGFDDARAMGFKAKSTGEWAATPEGAKAMWKLLGGSVADRRIKKLALARAFAESLRK